MDPRRLEELEQAGWHLTRDGSTATAQFAWDDPDDPESGWEILVLHTAGHGCRFTLNAFGSGLTERPPGDARALLAGLAQASALLAAWQGELPSEAVKGTHDS